MDPHAVHYSFVKFQWYCGENEEKEAQRIRAGTHT
jgi:hypothetical protein